MPTTISYPDHRVRYVSNRIPAVRQLAHPCDIALLVAWAILMLVISATLSAPETIEPYPSLFLNAF